MNLFDFVDAVQSFCNFTRASITSWGRTEVHNRAVGGVANSAHQFWLAIDVVYDEPIAEAHVKNIAARLGLRLIREGDHDHLQPMDWQAG